MPRPQRAPCAGCGRSSNRSTATPPAVRHQTRPAKSVAVRAWISATVSVTPTESPASVASGVSSRASRDSTPAGVSPAGRSVPVTVTTSAPRAASPSARAVTRTSSVDAAWYDEPPGAGQLPGGGQFGGAPHHPVAPVVDGGRVALTGPPGGEAGQHLGDDAGGDAEAVGEQVGVAPVDGVPESAVGVVGAGTGAGVGLDPVALVLEGVGGQLDRSAAGVDGGPVEVEAGGPRPGHPGGVAGDLVAVPALQRDRRRPRRRCRRPWR